MPGTVRLHLVLAAKPEKVYRAFIEPDAKTKWLPPNGFAATMHNHEGKVGGSYKMSSAISPRAAAIPSAALTLSSNRVNACATPTASTIPIFRAR